MEPKQVNQYAYNNGVVTVGDWVITFILLAIPIVNFILILVWAFGSSAPASKRNFARASLIFMVIGIVISVLSWSVLIAALSSFSSSYSF